MTTPPNKILILGATSAIAAAAAEQFAGEAAHFYLVGRDSRKLEALKVRLAALGAASVESQTADFSDFSRHPAIIEAAIHSLGLPDLVLVGHAIFGDDPSEPVNYDRLEEYVRVNFLSVASLFAPLVQRLLEQKAKCQLAVISSVAGDRGKARNFGYGISKAALTAYLQALRNSLHPHGIDVLTIKPGPVRTPMTAHLEKLPLAVSPETVARGIARAVRGGRQEVYLPWFWWPIMTLLKALPEGLFKRLRL